MVTRWKPDTCNCIIEFTSVGDVHTWVKSPQLCAKHDGLIGQAHLDAVLGHNRSFNNLIVPSPDSLGQVVQPAPATIAANLQAKATEKANNPPKTINP